jgi:hypothetical protein
MATTQIQVTRCDNELYIIASQPNGSSEMLHFKAGFSSIGPINVVTVPQHILNGGQYTLTMIGINWGGPAAFEVKVTTNGVQTVYPQAAIPQNTVGVVWTQSIPMTV